MISQIIGGGLSMVGSIIGAQRQAKAQEYAAQLQYRAIQDQLAQAAAERASADYYFGLQRKDADTLRDQYYKDANLRLSERDYTRNLMEGDRSIQMGDYQRQLERLTELDRKAADQRAFAIEQYLKSQTISASERARALQELERAQEIARGERDFELRELRANQLQRNLERQFQLEQLQRSQSLAMEDRTRDLATRARYDQAVNGYSDAITQTLLQLGALPNQPTLSRDEIAAEESRRRDIYERAVDRAADRASSQNEAALIKSGMDASTTGALRRSEVASKIAPLYEEAYKRAGDDALKYMVGLRDSMLTDYKTGIERRGIAVKEATSPYEAMLQSLLRTPQVATGMGADWRGVESGIYDKAIRSAGQYSTPLQVNSAFSTGALGPATSFLGMSTGYSPTMNLSTYGAGASGYLAPSGYFGQNPSGTGFLNSAATGMGNAYGAMSRLGAAQYSDAAARGDKYSAAFGKGLESLMNAVEGSDWFKNLGSGSGSFDFGGSSENFSFGAGGYEGFGPFM